MDDWIPFPAKPLLDETPSIGSLCSEIPCDEMCISQRTITQCEHSAGYERSHEAGPGCSCQGQRG